MTLSTLRPALEICIDATDPIHTQTCVRAAYEGGAERIELCRAMHLEGLTPAAPCIEIARSAFASRPGLIVMIRPRGGDFFYSAEEIKYMRVQIAVAARSGADGVALGALRQRDNHWDEVALKELVFCARGLGLAVTLHRALDATADRGRALETAIELGVQRVLSSGTAWGSDQGAIEGLDTLAALCKQAQGRIEIIAGGGIRRENAARIVRGLAAHNSPISLHVYSSVLENGRTTQNLVRNLVDICKT